MNKQQISNDLHISYSHFLAEMKEWIELWAEELNGKEYVQIPTIDMLLNAIDTELTAPPSDPTTSEPSA